MDNMRMFDLGTIGPKSTWSNKRKGLAHIKERLDKAVGNIEWRNRFPKAIFSVLTKGSSHHSPILFIGSP